MKKNLLIGIIAIIICFGLVGCGNNKKDDSELKDTYNKIGEYFGNESVDRSNFGAYYLDEDKNMVVVVLADNSKEQQEKFKKNVNINSKYIIFVQGGPYTTFSK
jgi:hypothetical protein